MSLAPEMTVREYAEAWLERDWRNRQQRHHALQHHILPTLGRLRLSELTPADVSELARAMVGRGLSAHTVSNVIRNVLSSLWNAAKRDGLVAGRLLSNVAIDAPASAWDTFTDDERERILEHFRGRKPDEYVLVACVFLAGMRPSEVARLRWRDVRTGITVRWTAGSTTAKGRVIRNSRVIVPPVRLLEILRTARRDARAGDRVISGRGWRAIDAKEWGSDVWADALRDLGIRPRRLSQARYSFIVERASAGVSLERLATYCGTPVGRIEAALGLRRGRSARRTSVVAAGTERLSRDATARAVVAAVAVEPAAVSMRKHGREKQAENETAAAQEHPATDHCP